MNFKPVIVLGAGGHAKVCIDILKRSGRDILGLVAPDRQSPALNVKQLGDDRVVLTYSPGEVLLVNGIGHMPRNKLRYDIYKKFKDKEYNFETLVHPDAVVADDVLLKEGAQVMAGAIIQPSTIVGRNTIVNTKVSIDHDGAIGSYCHIAPGATLCGGVVLKDHVFVGAGATIIQNVQVSIDAIISTGAVIKQDAEKAEVYG
ncbi:MAG: acetyltransferase [Gammaproteobacteria bacterium]|nr:acetyltransferase [Gammaproteobacteria bacterium]MCH9744486.1 acetyltransferase [Gammaproteobacteria bacterium]